MAARFGRRVSRGVTGTAIAAAAMAALTASQAPGLVAGAADRAAEATPSGQPIDGGSPYITGLPPLNSPVKPGTSAPTPPIPSPGSAPVAGGAGIPGIVLAAYKKAEATLAQTNPGCHLPWQLLAAIGQVESGQADGGNVNAQGTTLTPILGPLLNGSNGYATITNGNGSYAQAMGPMQFIPSTWATWGADGNGDGVKDPNNVFDAALAAGNYLCASGGDLSIPGNMQRAILGYNNSQAYLNTVLSWYSYFRNGGGVASGTGTGSYGSGGVPGTQPSPSASPSANGTPGGSSPSAAPSRSAQPTASASGSIGPVPGSSPSPSSAGSPSSSGSPTASGSPAPSGSPSGSPSGTPTACPTTSPTPSPTGSGTQMPTATPSPTPSGTLCTSPSPTPTASAPQPSPVPSESLSPSPSASG